MASSEEQYTNRLIHEASPYLLQHAHNPVDWHPWGEEAFEKARKENKLLLVSIGYAACHWCHVMERESFEDEEVAALMNAHFIPVKIDREERPDVDQFYMDAVMIMTGHGGWPLNAVALPDKRPVFGGTYFPKGKWMELLRQLAQLWRNEPDKVREYAQNLSDGIRSMEDLVIHEQEEITVSIAQNMLKAWQNQFDRVHGGSAGAPKFPMPHNWSFLLRLAHDAGNKDVNTFVQTTLNKMALGGIYDHLGGGWARYSVDDRWMVPHFEKMLYDNGQLVSLYSEAYRKFPEPLYARVVDETINWLEREMTDESGGFYASLDADSEGVEGKYYIWKADEIRDILGGDADWFNEFFSVLPHGNWEHGSNVLHATETQEKFALSLGISPHAFRANLKAAKEKLFAEREKRIRPALDDKILVSWNALMLSGLMDAWKTFREDRYLERGMKNADFLARLMDAEGRISRGYKAGRKYLPGFLEDYALLIKAFLDVFEVIGDAAWFDRAVKLRHFTDGHFLDEATGLYFFTPSDEETLIVRKRELTDNVIPSSNAVMADNLFRIARLAGDFEPEKQALSMLKAVKQQMERYPRGHSYWGQVLLKMALPFYEVAVAGPAARELAEELHRQFLPQAMVVYTTGSSANPEIFRGRFEADKSQIFVCRQHSCRMPVASVEDALEELKY